MLNPRFSTLLAVLFLSIATTSSSPTHKHAKRGLDTGSIAQQRFGNDSAWYQDRIPYFDSSDSLINDVYYYRWQVLRAHQRDLGPRGYISTEFAQDVSWQFSPWAILKDATGFHLKVGGKGEVQDTNACRLSLDLASLISAHGKRDMIDVDSKFQSARLDEMQTFERRFERFASFETCGMAGSLSGSLTLKGLEKDPWMKTEMMR